MTEDRATERPWHVEEWGPDVLLDQVCRADGSGVAVTYEQTGLFTPADAALIVEAVNAYDRLREALGRIAENSTDVHAVEVAAAALDPATTEPKGRSIADVLVEHGYECPLCGEPHMPALSHTAEELRAWEDAHPDKASAASPFAVHVNDGSAHDHAMAWSEGYGAGFLDAKAELVARSLPSAPDHRLRAALEQITMLGPIGPFRRVSDELAAAQSIARAVLSEATPSSATPSVPLDVDRLIDALRKSVVLRRFVIGSREVWRPIANEVAAEYALLSASPLSDEPG